MLQFCPPVFASLFPERLQHSQRAPHNELLANAAARRGRHRNTTRVSARLCGNFGTLCAKGRTFRRYPILSAVYLQPNSRTVASKLRLASCNSLVRPQQARTHTRFALASRTPIGDPSWDFSCPLSLLRESCEQSCNLQTQTHGFTTNLGHRHRTGRLCRGPQPAGDNNILKHQAPNTKNYSYRHRARGQLV